MPPIQKSHLFYNIIKRLIDYYMNSSYIILNYIIIINITIIKQRYRPTYINNHFLQVLNWQGKAVLALLNLKAVRSTVGVESAIKAALKLWRT